MCLRRGGSSPLHRILSIFFYVTTYPFRIAIQMTLNFVYRTTFLQLSFLYMVSVISFMVFICFSLMFTALFQARNKIPPTAAEWKCDLQFDYSKSAAIALSPLAVEACRAQKNLLGMHGYPGSTISSVAAASEASDSIFGIQLPFFVTASLHFFTLPLQYIPPFSLLFPSKATLSSFDPASQSFERDNRGEKSYYQKQNEARERYFVAVTSTIVSEKHVKLLQLYDAQQASRKNGLGYFRDNTDRINVKNTGDKTNVCNRNVCEDKAGKINSDLESNEYMTSFRPSSASTASRRTSDSSPSSSFFSFFTPSSSGSKKSVLDSKSNYTIWKQGLDGSFHRVDIPDSNADVDLDQPSLASKSKSFRLFPSKVTKNRRLNQIMSVLSLFYHSIFPIFHFLFSVLVSFVKMLVSVFYGVVIRIISIVLLPFHGARYVILLPFKPLRWILDLAIPFLQDPESNYSQFQVPEFLQRGDLPYTKRYDPTLGGVRSFLSPPSFTSRVDKTGTRANLKEVTIMIDLAIPEHYQDLFQIQTELFHLDPEEREVHMRVEEEIWIESFKKEMNLHGKKAMHDSIDVDSGDDADDDDYGNYGDYGDYGDYVYEGNVDGDSVKYVENDAGMEGSFIMNDYEDEPLGYDEEEEEVVLLCKDTRTADGTNQSNERDRRFHGRSGDVNDENNVQSTNGYYCNSDANNNRENTNNDGNNSNGGHNNGHGKGNDALIDKEACDIDKLPRANDNSVTKPHKSKSESDTDHLKAQISTSSNVDHGIIEKGNGMGIDKVNRVCSKSALDFERIRVDNNDSNDGAAFNRHRRRSVRRAKRRHPRRGPSSTARRTAVHQLYGTKQRTESDLNHLLSNGRQGTRRRAAAAVNRSYRWRLQKDVVALKRSLAEGEEIDRRLDSALEEARRTREDSRFAVRTCKGGGECKERLWRNERESERRSHEAGRRIYASKGGKKRIGNEESASDSSHRTHPFRLASGHRRPRASPPSSSRSSPAPSSQTPPSNPPTPPPRMLDQNQFLLTQHEASLLARGSKTYLPEASFLPNRILKSLLLAPIRFVGLSTTAGMTVVRLPMVVRFRDDVSGTVPPATHMRVRLSSRSGAAGLLPPPPVHWARIRIQPRSTRIQNILARLRPSLLTTWVLGTVFVATAMGSLVGTVGSIVAIIAVKYFSNRRKKAEEAAAEVAIAEAAMKVRRIREAEIAAENMKFELATMTTASTRREEAITKAGREEEAAEGRNTKVLALVNREHAEKVTQGNEEESREAKEKARGKEKLEEEEEEELTVLYPSRKGMKEDEEVEMESTSQMKDVLDIGNAESYTTSADYSISDQSSEDRRDDESVYSDSRAAAEEGEGSNSEAEDEGELAGDEEEGSEQVSAYLDLKQDAKEKGMEKGEGEGEERRKGGGKGSERNGVGKEGKQNERTFSDINTYSNVCNNDEDSMFSDFLLDIDISPCDVDEHMYNSSSKKSTFL